MHKTLLSSLLLSLTIHQALWLSIEIEKKDFNKEKKQKRIQISLRDLGNKGQSQFDIKKLGLTSVSDFVSIKQAAIKNNHSSYDHSGINKTAKTQVGALNKLGVVSMGIEFLDKKGISEDELNSHEKKFYSFKQRVNQAFSTNINKQFLLLSEKEKKLMFSNQMIQDLIGKVEYSMLGQANSIDFLKKSKNKRVQKVFQKIIYALQTLPNPPKEILTKDGFKLRYRLKIIPY